MKLSDIPIHPAYVVCHDEYDRGAMEIWPATSTESATEMATKLQEYLDSRGLEGCHYLAYAKLPRVRVWEWHSEPHK